MGIPTQNWTNLNCLMNWENRTGFPNLFSFLLKTFYACFHLWLLQVEMRVQDLVVCFMPRFSFRLRNAWEGGQWCAFFALSLAHSELFLSHISYSARKRRYLIFLRTVYEGMSNTSFLLLLRKARQRVGKEYKKKKIRCHPGEYWREVWKQGGCCLRSPVS